jgi:hypothetical protein
MEISRDQYQNLRGVQDTHELASLLMALPNSPFNIPGENGPEVWSEAFEPENAKQASQGSVRWSAEYVQVAVHVSHVS